MSASFFVSGDQLVEGWRPRSVADLQPSDLAALFALQPTVILLGTGHAPCASPPRPSWPPP
jgi:uncharacterized protein